MLRLSFLILLFITTLSTPKPTMSHRFVHIKWK
uniref:Uncharacterized protein n=1 Tax=Anguilla anguilla TaxID=7936 RepID=A0A0E9S5N2_ANGAN